MRIARFCHFAIHGFHHFAPTEASKLVFPVPSAILLYKTSGIAHLPRFILIGYGGEMFIFGNIIGYILYDLTHYMIHHMVILFKFRK